MTVPNLSHWLEREPFSLSAADKNRELTAILTDLTAWHAAGCCEYAELLRILGFTSDRYNNVEEIPFIPVRLFKEFDLLSVDRASVFKTMTSSGTSGQQVSRIYLDRKTASLQTKVLGRIIGSLLGNKRIPMLVIDSPATIINRVQFSARGAGILGYSMFGKDVTYALREDMSLDLPSISAFIDRHAPGPIFVFGFTFVVWKHFVLPLLEHNDSLNIPGGILLHGGGWKKLQDSAVSGAILRAGLKRVANIGEVHDYYGMVEQTGSVFIECHEGHLHAPIFGDVVIRNPDNFEPLKFGEEGVVEVLSVVPLSYPGHALLTEDVGTVLGEDDCRCGRRGKYFTVAGRLAGAETRGCSDTYESPV